jgi:TonB family protein
MNTKLLRLLRARRGFFRLLRERPISGAVLSVLVHALVVVLVVWLGLPLAQPSNARRGEPLFVELPQIPEPAPRGNPAARERGPDSAAESPPPPPPSPPPRAKAPPAPRPAPAPSRPATPPPSRVAAAPRASPPEPPRPARPAEPAPPVEAKPAPPVPPSTPAPSAPASEKAVQSPAPRSAAPGPAAPVPPAPSVPALPSTPSGPAVAAIPREGGGRGAAPDMRSALRRGGAGGSSDGRGGIEGEPIPLDSPDPKYSDYLDRVRRMIKDKWIYPCVPNPINTRQCEYKSAQLEIEFGIAKDGRVPFVIVRAPSQHGIYDEYAVNAIKLASPFPPVPDEMGKKGIPILARFNYILESSSSLTNILR